MIHRKIKKGIVATCLTLVMAVSGFFQSCNFLDIDPYVADLFTLDTVFQKKEYTQRYLANVYSYLVDYSTAVHDAKNSMPWVLITDEGVCSYKQSSQLYNYFSNNEMTPDNLGEFDRWDYFYEGIRKANTFLQRVNECQEVSPTQRSEWTGEAKFIKAMIYFELMLAFGPVPIVPDQPVDFDTPITQMMVERNTWDECNTYVSALLEDAIKLLPNTLVDNSEIGRSTKHSAMAVLSRLTLYTASPLYNGENKEFLGFRNNAGIPYLNPEKSIGKWAVAAANAKRLVDQKPNDLYVVAKMDNTPELPVPAADKDNFPNGVGGIDPYHSYSDMFTGECILPSSNREILFVRRSTGHDRMNWYCAPAMLNCWGSFSVPQNLVDAYYMADGTDIKNTTLTPDNDFTDTDVTFSGEKNGNGFTVMGNTYKWFVNREMRFYATIGYNNSFYPSTSTPPDKVDQQDGKVAKFFRDSRSGKDYALNMPSGDPNNYSMTGYLCRKFVHYEDSWISGGRYKDKYSPTYRMAEVYLNYVEAMNELDGSHTLNGVTVSRDPAEMKRCFNLIRYRAGLPGITDQDVTNVERMRELILRERQIEFAWEARRYHDLRRTKKAVVYENMPTMGCDVNANESEGTKFYNKIKVKERDYIYKVFTDRQTFMPIPKHEIDKNLNLDQIPGY